MLLLGLTAFLAACGTAPAEAPAPPVMPSVQAPVHTAAPEAVPAPAPLPPPPVLAGHLASYRTLTEAEAAWPRLLERVPDLRQEPKRLIEVDLGPQRGKVVRLLVGGFASPEQTSQFCHKVKQAGVYCAPHDLPPENS